MASALSSLPRPVRIVATLVLAGLAGWACERLGTPLPWMIGPLLVTAAGCVAGLPLAGSTVLRSAGHWAIGTALGLYFTPQVVGVVLHHAAGIVAGIVWALALGLAFGLVLARLHRGRPGLNAATTYFASAIGGASEMAMLAERHGGRVDLVASAHSVRILLVVILLPFGFQALGLRGLDPFVPGPAVVHGAGLALLIALTCAGSLLLQHLGKPTPWVLGSLAVAATLTASGVELSALPTWMTHLGQVFIGVALGTRFSPDFVRTAPRWLASVAVGTLAMIVLCAGFAWVLARWVGLHPATVMLGTSPGGIAEMCITAKVLQLGVPIVTAFHVTRMAAVVLLSGPLFGWLSRRGWLG
ncbi:AbrB family transcriptional regulator [Caldimonas sp.]|uniref:AbrB family transcriptional regulator n=1 Tax=Caldimonas sp. TaxID=2838790 RepID=UPI003918EFB7